MSIGVVRQGGIDMNGRVLCDAGPLAHRDCEVSASLPEEGTAPDGWASRPDPFGRVTRSDHVFPGRTAGDVIVLHLCPACQRSVPEGAE